MEESKNPVVEADEPIRNAVAIVSASVMPDGLVMPLHVSTSLDTSKSEDRQLLAKIMIEDGGQPEDYINREIQIEHVAYWPIQWVDEETGEEVKTYSIVLIQPDRSTIQFKSLGIFKSLCALYIAYGNPPWSGPVKAILERKQLRSGRSMYRLKGATQLPTIVTKKSK